MFAAVAASVVRAQVVPDAVQLVPSDPTPGNGFGSAVAVSGSVAIVGAPSDVGDDTRSGAAFLFDITNGTQLAKLVPEDGSFGDTFGRAVAISGAIAVVASRGDDDNGTDSGSAYVFDTATGQQLAKLVPTDGAAFDRFGEQVAVSGNLAVVGASGDDNGSDTGSAYVFDVTTGQQVSKLIPTDGVRNDLFGFSVDIHDGIAIVGAMADSDLGLQSGSAYLFDAMSGQQIAKLLPDDGTERDFFGISVAIERDTVVVGTASPTRGGAAYLFCIASDRQIARIRPDASTGGFGRDLDIAGRSIVVGAASDDANGRMAGAAFVFDAIGGREVAKLLPSDGTDNDRSGASVATNGRHSVVGSLRSPGVVYVFPAPCQADLWGPGPPDGLLTSADFFEFLSRFDVGDRSVDFSSPNIPGRPDGLLTGADFFGFLDLFAAGC